MTQEKSENKKATPIWKTIAGILQNEIGIGVYGPGEKLPTEANLAQRFKVNRHTIRHAISSLRDEGVLFSKQGAGVYVATKPTTYEIGRRVRFHQSMDREGHTANKTTLRLETRKATKEEAAALKIKVGSDVVIHEGIGFIDDLPITHFVSAYPVKKIPNLANVLAEEKSITKALKKCGINDYLRAETRLTAVLCNAATASHLNLKPGAPLLRSLSINSDLNGNNIEYGQTWFSGNHIELVIKGQ